MEILGLLLMMVGGIGCLIGGIWFLIVAFQESVVWGLACMFIPFVSLIFLVTHWEDAGKPFLIQIVSLVPIIAGVYLAPPAA